MSQAPAPVVVAAVEPAARPKPAPEAVAAVQPSEAASRNPGRHRVVRGEHLGAIAQGYGVSLEGLAQANDLAPPYVIHVGQVLQIPDGAEVEPRRYVVARGDTLSGVAQRFDVAASDVAAANGIDSPYQLSVGQRLEIPGTQTVKAVPDAAPPPLTGAGFLWPVDGKLIGKFGATDDGQRQNGINIAARKGAPVVASEDGIVVYASDGIHGYGRMILVRHAEGYITTYAHNAALLVEVGDVVRRGQVIARVGDTGDVSQSQLHFELRKGTKAINPEAVLVRQSTAVASTS
jgi:murein DD-endopeptidase MepM/ murein hydrolase activator NlpD